jgi:RNA polymerase sigma factor (sigma-70 family)
MAVATKTRAMLEPDQRSDGDLLAAVLSRAAQDCFAELVRRHGPMVLGVCRRQLGDRHDAEDAAQAVFLVLWQKAGGLRRRPSLAGWLHQVAGNICRNARRARNVRRKHEREAAARLKKASGQHHHEEWERIKDLLDGELDALPEKYRTPLVLFHLESRSLEETAALLRLKTSTLTTRLQRGRDMLRQRLALQGIALSTTALATLLIANDLTAAMPLFFAETTAKAANLYALGQTTAGGLVSTQAVALTKGAFDMLTGAKIRMAVSVLLAPILLVTAGSFVIWQTLASSAPTKRATRAVVPSGDEVPPPSSKKPPQRPSKTKHPATMEPTPIEQLQKHIAWGKPNKKGLQVGVVLDPHRDTYQVGEVARCRFFYRNSGNEKLTLNPPKLLETRVTKLHVSDDQGKPIAVVTKSDKEPLWLVGAFRLLLDPGQQAEVNGSSLAIGKGDEDNALINVVKAKAGQSCRLHFTLNDYLDRFGNELNTGIVRFKVVATKASDAEPEPVVKELADPGEVARMKKYYPHGFNFVDTIRPDGKITWLSKVVQGNKVLAKNWEFTTVAAFKKAFLKEMIDKKASIEVHLPLVNPQVSWAAQGAAHARQILDFAKEKGYTKAGKVSN